MIESARAMVRIKEIAQAGEGYLDALLVSLGKRVSGLMGSSLQRIVSDR